MAEETKQNEHLNEESAAAEPQEANGQAATETENTDNSSENSAIPSPEEQIAALNDKYLRLYSEFDNYRKRTNKEKLELIATASAGVLKDLIVVLDDFERAILNNEQAEDIQAIKDGIALIHSKFKTTLEAKGLKQMQSKNEAFDPELHEAIANIPAPSEELKGKVIDDVEKGYYLNDKVIRYAKVVVGQ
ncbi:MAG TPA: nucleotide exchange factor GrpE [Fluviicola sp.]|nr:nucleotide exchange factor GrpE [Fluviicola sp.]